MSTFSGDYQILVLSPIDGSQLDLIDQSRWYRLQYSRYLNDVGEFALTIPATDRLFTYWEELDLIIEIYRRNAPYAAFEKEDTFLVRSPDLGIDSDTNEEFLILSGVSLADLIKARIVLPDDDPVGAAGFVTRSGSAASVMDGLVNYQIVSPQAHAERALSNFNIGTYDPSRFQNAYVRVKQEDNLLETIQNICKAALCDFTVTRTTGREMLFTPANVGRNMTQTNNYPAYPFILFTPKRGNLANPRIRLDRKDEITVMYVAQQGLGEARLYVPVQSGRENASPFNWRESAMDARTAESLDEINTAGQAELYTTAPRIEFSAEPVISLMSGQYNIDWFLGDKVTIEYQGYSEDHRIIKVLVDISEAGEDIRIETVKYPP